MRIFASAFLAVSSAFAYQITYPGGSQGWNTTGPNQLMWERVDTDPVTFAAVLTNVNTNSNQVMDAVINGTLNIVTCTPPSGGWVAGSGFRVNLVQDAEHLDNILAQSSLFNITAVASSSSGSIQTTASAPAASALTTSAPTTSAPTTTSSVSSSDTSTTPTGVSAASLSIGDAKAGLLTAVAALAAFITTLF